MIALLVPAVTCALLSTVFLSVGAIAESCRAAGTVPAGATMASWYGQDHHGQKTAGGDGFDEHRLTAAHPFLPLHSFIRVTNLTNGRWTRVEITDRGPGRGRGIDLSEAAADAIGMRRCGLVPVTIAADRSSH
jgi:rare lipoprotein A